MVTMGDNGHSVVVEIGGLPVGLRTTAPDFAELLEGQYAGFLAPGASAASELDVTLVPPGTLAGTADVEVHRQAGCWVMTRGDFRAEWDPRTRRGQVQQSANPYAIDSVLRILHTLLLSNQGGFLVHAASAVRNGRAFLFAGPSGAGKTTLVRLAPADAVLLSDEISYVRRLEEGYRAFGTPFTGELARAGENLSAPLAGFYLLEKGPGTRIEPLAEAEAVRAVLQNILFFAEEPGVVQQVFGSVCEFVRRVPVRRLRFAPEPAVWEAIA